MECSQLAEDSRKFIACADETRGPAKSDRDAKRRLENARRRLIRSIVRTCHTLNADKVCSVAEYVLLIAS